MKKITLSQVIKEQNLKDPAFARAYQKELLINAISKMIIKLRRSVHLTQAGLAKKTGTTQPVIARLEAGTDSRIPSLDLLTRIAVAVHARLNISFEEMD